MKRLFALFLCIITIAGCLPVTAIAAPEWPSGVSVEADGAIVIDADSGAVLYGKNIHQTYFPASITKILTALITIENCENLDEIVTFSHDAIYNVESNSSNMGAREGDQLTVRECLYGLMLQSANEAANALAEHVAGSVEAFAVMMNEKAASLGCTDSNFANPSGLNNPEHYTSAHDMALIMKAALDNPVFVEVDSSLYYKITSPMEMYPEGNTVYAHHRMLKKNDALYYPGAFAGKTGYTSLAGNTLVTAAKRDSMTLISVVLNGHQTHYSDTRALLDFGFQNFQSMRIADYDKTYQSITNDMTIAGLATTDISALTINQDSYITLPLNTQITDAQTSLDYNLTGLHPENAVAKINYTYNDRVVGSAYLELKDAAPAAHYDELEAIPTTAAMHVDAPEEIPSSPENPKSSESSGEQIPSASEADSEGNQEPAEKEGFQIPSAILTVLGVLAGIAVLGALLIFIKLQIEKKEERERRLRRERRQMRLRDIGCSAAEFDLLMEQKKRSSLSAGKRRKKPKKRNR